MRTTTILALTASFLSTTEAFTIRQKEDAGALKVVSLQTERRSVPDPTARDRLRRRREKGWEGEIPLENVVSLPFSRSVESVTDTMFR